MKFIKINFVAHFKVLIIIKENINKFFEFLFNNYKDFYINRRIWQYK